MKKTAIAAFLLATTGFTAQADTMGLSQMNVNIHVSDRTNAGDYVFYDCDYARDVAKDILRELGAQNAKVTCTGGFDRHGNMAPMPIQLHTEFAAFSSTGEGEHATVADEFSIKYTNDCHLPHAVFETLLPHFETSNVAYTEKCSTMARGKRFEATGTAPEAAAE